ncbi:hypothetical protein Gpo141_00005377 [Globisporangium polare]
MQSTALEFGVINTLRTGHAVYDLMICMTVPAVIQAATTSGKDSLAVLRAVREAIRDALFKKSYVTHTVETTEHHGRSGTMRRFSSSDVRGNELLQKAILLYLGEHLSLDNENGRYELLEVPRMKQKLIENHLGGLEIEKRKRILALLQHKDAAAVPEVAKLGANPLPALNEWVKIGDGIEFMNETTMRDVDNSSSLKESKVIFHFRSSARDGPERIDALITKAFEFYRESENKKFKDDSARYMYVHSSERPPQGDTDDESKLAAPYHKRYALGNDKMFANVFIPEKAQLLRLIDHFVNKTGKFAIHGFPNKLGLLLYGPPGTGKTSLIKAVAQYTGRHIVNISLGKIKTNQELMDAMFDLRYAVDGLDLPVRLDFKDVVFVMEDIDCATSVVTSRDTKASASTPTKPTDGDASQQPAAEREPSVGGEGSEDLEINEDDEDMNGFEVEEGGYEDDEDDEDIFMDEPHFGGGGPGDLFAAFLSAQMGAFSASEGDMYGPKAKGGFVSSSNSSDKLNLAGLLNVLDGVIDCPGRIVIMTTNHPEKLDPALIRPGRISKKLHLGYMASAEVQEMVEYYFTTKLSEEQANRLRTGLEGKTRLSPAFIEELCAEFDDVDAVLSKIVSEES